VVQELLIVELRTSLEFVFPVKEQEISILEQYNEVNWTFIGLENRRI